VSLSIKKTRIERIRVTCPMAESKKAIDYCDDRGYHMKYSGPKMKGPGRRDMSRFRIMAEREG